MATDSGYSNQKKKGLAQFETVHNLGSSAFGKVAANKALYEITSSSPIVSVSDIIGSNGQVEYWNIELTAHGASVGNVFRIDAGSLINTEFEILSVVDANNFYVLPISETKPVASDTGVVMGWVTVKVGSDGSTNISITSAPTSYNLDGLPQTVEQDTVDPTNNRALPNLAFIIKDGVQVPITKDTGLPSNTVGMPVELVAASGTPINITAGDINVQLSDQGVNFDSLRLGDGSGIYLQINADGSANIFDKDGISIGGTISAEKLKLVGGQIVSWADINGGSIPTQGAGGDAATLAMTEDGQQLVYDPLNNAELVILNDKIPLPVGGGVPVTVTNFPATQNVAGTVAVNNFPATQPISAASLPLPTGAATSANQATEQTLIGDLTETAPATDTASSGLNGRLQRIAQRLTSLISLFPLSLGQKTMANSFAVTLASDQTALSTTQTALTASYQEVINLTTVAQTVTPPASAKWVKIYAEDTNGANVRVRLAGTATTSSGVQLQPGRAEDFAVVGTGISVIAESGTNQKVNFTFGA